MEIDDFLHELMDLITVEANNGDYYMDGTVPGYLLDDLINKHFADELGYEFSSADTYSRWYPRTPTKSGTIGDFIPKVYEQALIEALKKPLFLEDIPKTMNDDGTVTFKVSPFKKDGQS